MPAPVPAPRGGPSGRGLMSDDRGRRKRPARATPKQRTEYLLEGPKPARIYEVIIPKKLGYFGKIQEILEDLFDESAILRIPFVQDSIEKRRDDPRFDQAVWIKSL